MMQWIFVHIASGNDLLPICGQAITWTNVALLSTERLGTINMYHFPFKKCIWTCHPKHYSHANFVMLSMCPRLNNWI